VPIIARDFVLLRADPIVWRVCCLQEALRAREIQNHTAPQKKKKNNEGYQSTRIDGPWEPRLMLLTLV
jgi:hypothetical protein